MEYSNSDYFEWEAFIIRNEEFDVEKMIIIKDKYGDPLEMYASMQTTENAGVEISFYVKNVIINLTDQELKFAYDKKHIVGG